MTSQETLNKILDEIKASNDQHKQDFKELKTSNDQIRKDFKELKTLFTKVKEENTELKKVVTQLKTNNKSLEIEVKHLSAGFNRLLQEKFNNNFIIPGIPIAAQEDLPKIVQKIGTLLKIDLDKKDFVVRRISSKSKQSTSLLVETSKKVAFFQSRKKYTILLEQLGFVGAEGKKEIFFYHQLTKHNQELLNLAKTDLKKNNFVKYVWFQNNHILVRQNSNSSFLSVHCSKDISDLVEKFKPKLVDTIDLSISSENA